MADHQVIVEVTDRLAWLSLDRPPKNLLDAELTEQLAETLLHLDDDPGVDVIALTGRGDYFCGGADGPVIRQTGTARRFADAAVQLFGHMPRAKKPILAAVNGDALAGGFGLVCSADIVITVPGTQIGTIEASLGTWPMIAQVPASRRVPPKAAITNLLTGVPFSAERALALGIVDEIVPADDLHDRVAHYARLAVGGGTAALRGRRLFYASFDVPLEQSLREGADAFVAGFAS